MIHASDEAAVEKWLAEGGLSPSGRCWTCPRQDCGFGIAGLDAEPDPDDPYFDTDPIGTHLREHEELDALAAEVAAAADPVDGVPATEPAPSTATVLCGCFGCLRRIEPGMRVRVRPDFEVPDLAGLVGTLTGLSGRDAAGRYVDVDLPEFGPVPFLPAELEQVEDDAGRKAPA